MGTDQLQHVVGQSSSLCLGGYGSSYLQGHEVKALADPRVPDMVWIYTGAYLVVATHVSVC